MNASSYYRQLLEAHDAVFVTIDSFEGSSPREVGAWMLVQAHAVQGTIGGGHLEFEAIALARTLLGGAGPDPNTQPGTPADTLRRYPLGPALGQCCGGVVQLKFAFIGAGDTIKIEAVCSEIAWARGLNSLKIVLFGGGHVGTALASVLGTLPCTLRWVDSRDEIFPAQLPHNVVAEHSDPVQAAVSAIAAGSHVLVMSFSHAEDLDIIVQCLLRLRSKNDLPFIGLIGSKTKWASFRQRLTARGFSAAEIARVTCPIGTQGIAGKEPEVIAVSVAAQLLSLRAIN